MIASKSSRFRLQLQKIVFNILLLTGVGLLAWLSLQNPVESDWSANKRNSISAKSIEVLASMPDDVIVNVYVQDNEMTHKAISEILQRYQREKSNFEFHLINPDIDIVQAEQDGIKQYGQVVIKYQDKKEIIASLSERTISSALLRLSHSKERNIVFLSGHGERNPIESNNRGYSQLTKQLQSDGFKITKLHLLQGNIATNTSTFVIAGASHTLLAGEVEKILEHINNGGNLLWLVDPGELHGLDKLAELLGLSFHPGLVVDNNIDLRKTLQIEHPAIIPVLEYFPHKITQNIKYNTLFPTARGLEVTITASSLTWLVNDLFASFEKSWSESNGIASKIVFNSLDGDIAGPITLGVALQRELNDDTPNQRIVVIGDSDFLANSYIGAGANLSLGINIMNWLAGDNTLLSITPNSAPDTKLLLNDIEIALIGMGFFIAMPLFLLITGLTIWLKRRNT